MCPRLEVQQCALVESAYRLARRGSTLGAASQCAEGLCRVNCRASVSDEAS